MATAPCRRQVVELARRTLRTDPRVLRRKTPAMTAISMMTSPTRRVVVLAPRGALGIDDCTALRDALRGATPEAGLIVVDLLDVPEIDDAAVEVLVGASTRCLATGKRFVVANAGPQPWLALTRARVAGVLRLHQRGTEPLAELLQLLEL